MNDERSDFATLEVRVKPRSSHSQLRTNPGGGLQASLQAPPQQGRANTELVQLVAKSLGIPKGRIELWKGLKSREKVLRIWGVSQAACDRAVKTLFESQQE